MSSVSSVQYISLKSINIFKTMFSLFYLFGKKLDKLHATKAICTFEAFLPLLLYGKHANESIAT